MVVSAAFLLGSMMSRNETDARGDGWNANMDLDERRYGRQPERHGGSAVDHHPRARGFSSPALPNSTPETFIAILSEDTDVFDATNRLAAVGALRVFVEQQEQSAVVEGRSVGQVMGQIASLIGRGPEAVRENHRHLSGSADSGSSASHVSPRSISAGCRGTGARPTGSTGGPIAGHGPGIGV